MDLGTLRAEIAIAQSIHRELLEMLRVLLSDLPIYQCENCRHVSTDRQRPQPCQRSAFVCCPTGCRWAPMTPQQALDTRFHLFDPTTKLWLCDVTVFDKMLAMVNGDENLFCRP